MVERLVAAILVVWLFGALLVARLHGDGLEDDPPDNVKNGRRLFERVWLVGSDPKKSDDGLGPLFNERSCVACHSQGGIGGAGPNEKNVEMLSVVVPNEWQWTRSELQSVLELSLHHVGPGNPQLLDLQRRATRIHKSLNSGSMVVHSFGADSRYAANRERILGLTPTPEAARPPVGANGLPPLRRATGTDPVRAVRHGDVMLQFSGRNSTSMFGAGLIDEIPEATLRSIAAEQEENGKVSGRYTGRFGWRGQMVHLDGFVLGACDIELGLDVEQAAIEYAMTRAGMGTPAVRSKKSTATGPAEKFDLGEKDAYDLVAFVASLAAPQRRLPTDKKKVAAVAHGETLFGSIGCGECHRPSIGDVEGIYSDLLVHDMGTGLADPAGPTRDDSKPMKLEPVRVMRISRGDGKASLDYYSDTFKPPRIVATNVISERLQEWKTPPLWGLADLAPYLHDGRAATVDDAIRAHGGEATESAVAYRFLPPTDQQDVLAFLATFVAPPALKPLAP